MYNKTALYRMKKDDLMQLFLDQQAEKNQLVLDAEENDKLEKVFNPKTTSEYRALFNRLGISSDGLKGKKAHLDKYEEYKKSLPEYSKLKEENEKLKDEACDYESMRKHRDTLLEESEERFMKIHNLEEQNEKLKSHMIYMGHNKIKADLKKLKAENEKLKEANDTFTLGAKRTIENNCKLYQENKKLQTQIDNLKGDVKFWSDKAEVIKRDHDQLDENYKLHKKSADIYEEKLIEEIEILRKKPNIENEKLKEENQNFKEILDEVREYLGRFDGDEVEVFDKIVKGE